MAESIPLVEAFGPTIQGEGALTGQISYFLRFGGCDFDCSWCDSMHAVDPDLIKKHARYLSRAEILEVARGLNKHPEKRAWITLSGGNPAIWDLQSIVIGLKTDGMKVAIETQGSIHRVWFDYLDLITVSPKGPSSGMANRLDLEVLDALHKRYGPGVERINLKVVIFNQADLDFAETLKLRYPRVPFYLSVGTPLDDGNPKKKTGVSDQVIKNYRWLASEFLLRTTLWGSIISPQMHVLLYGHDKGK